MSWRQRDISKGESEAEGREAKWEERRVMSEATGENQCGKSRCTNKAAN